MIFLFQFCGVDFFSSFFLSHSVTSLMQCCYFEVDRFHFSLFKFQTLIFFPKTLTFFCVY